MNSAISCGSKFSSSNSLPTSMMLTVRVRGGTKSVRVNLSGVSHQPTTGNAEFSGERRERGNGPQPRPAVLIALEAVAPGDDRGGCITVPLCQRPDVIRRDAANLCGARGRVSSRGFHIGVESQNVLIDERTIEASDSLQLHRK